MELTLKELNTLYYSLNVAVTHHSEHKLLDVNELNELIDKVRDEIDLVIYEMDNNEDDGPEYDSAGFTEDDRIVNGQYRVISNEAADEDAKLSWYEQNKERILAEDQLRHDMQFKSSYAKHGNY
jgi:hypothetical protein